MSRHRHAMKSRQLPEITGRARNARRRPEGGDLLKLIRTTRDHLLDLEFNQYLTLRLLPVCYVLLIATSFFMIVRTVISAFAVSSNEGLFWLMVALPAFLGLVIASRVLIECLIVLFRMSEDVRRLAGIRPAIDRLDGMLSGNHWLTRLIKGAAGGRESSGNTPHAD